MQLRIFEFDRRRVFRRVSLAALFVLLSAEWAVSLDPQTTATKVSIEATDIAKIIVVPILLWMAHSVAMNGVTRYHAIRSLFAEIDIIVGWYKGVRPQFDAWLTNSNIPTGPFDAADLSRISWNLPLRTPIYDNSQGDIKASLWLSEFQKLHSLYGNFHDVHARFGALAREIDKAKENKLRHIELVATLPAGGAAQKSIADISAASKVSDSDLIRMHMTGIDKSLKKVCNYHSGYACADAQFIPMYIYSAHVALVALFLFLAVIAIKTI